MAISDIVKNQLYNLITELDLSVGHRDTTGLLIGNSVIVGLLNFHSSVSKKESLQKNRLNSYAFMDKETVKTYKRSEVRSISESLKFSTELSQNGSPESALLHLDKILTSDFVPLIASDVKYGGDSVLLERILYNMNGSNDYSDVLRRRGLLLLDNVKSRKSRSRPEDIAKEDYNSIHKTFVDTKLL